jgi:hypothetical protein
MGVAVVGGMLTSTLLTLFVLPVVYRVFSDVVAWFQRARPASAPVTPAPSVSGPGL